MLGDWQEAMMPFLIEKMVLKQFYGLLKQKGGELGVFFEKHIEDEKRVSQVNIMLPMLR